MTQNSQTAVATPKLASRLAGFIARIIASPEVALAGERCGLAPSEAERLLKIYTNEAHVGLELVMPLLHPGQRVLEIGCGIGVLSTFLIDEGFNLTGIEPGSSGFGFMPQIGAEILKLSPQWPGLCWLDIGAKQLNPAQHGMFDLIYSVNVLEHVSDLEGAFRGMSSVLAPGGSMIHMCPNYFVPYEPHFGIPLIPFKPRATRMLFPETVKKYPGIWDELNFITAGRVKRLALANRMNVSFDGGVLASMLRRFERDPVFRRRQGALAALAHRIISGLKLTTLLGAVPGAYMTPMVLRLNHAGVSAIGGEVQRTRQ